MMRPTPVTGVLGKAIALIAGAMALVLGFMFSLVLVGFVLVAGLVAGIYFWWKTRALRKAMRAQAPAWERQSNGQVIDGEAVVVEEFTMERERVLPGDPDKP